MTRGRTLGQIQGTINSALYAMGWKVLTSGAGKPPLPAYSYAAIRYPNSDPSKRQGLFIDVEMEGGKAIVIADWYIVAGPSRPRAQAKAFYDDFFGKLAAALK